MLTSPEPTLPVSRDALIGSLFEPDVLAASSPLTASVDDLLPQERRLVSRAIPSRQREFAAGRACARALLAQLGVSDFALLRRPDRTPVWPEAIVGSISHADGLCAVAVARRGIVIGLGVDVEPDLPLERPLWQTICTDAECAWIERQPPDHQSRLARVFFSAKESVYKCLYPAKGLQLEFHDVQLEFEPEAGQFFARVSITDEMPVDEELLPSCSIAVRDGWILTGVTLRCSGI